VWQCHSDIILDPFSLWLSLRHSLCCLTTSLWRSLFENHMIDIILCRFLYDIVYFLSSEWHYLVTLSILRHLSDIVYFMSSEWHYIVTISLWRCCDTMGSATKATARTGDGYFFQYFDFSSNVIKNFQDFRDKKELYDVTLTCDDHSYVQVKNKTILASV